MRKWEREFVIPDRNVLQSIGNVWQFLCTYNSRRLGRCRRGSVFLFGCRADYSSAELRLVLMFRRGGSPWLRCRLRSGQVKLQWYPFADHRRLLSKLSKLSR